MKITVLMSLTKSEAGEIVECKRTIVDLELCCEELPRLRKASGYDDEVSFYNSSSAIRVGKRGQPEAIFRDKHYDTLEVLPMEFCPGCGAKTEYVIETRERTKKCSEEFVPATVKKTCELSKWSDEIENE